MQLKTMQVSILKRAIGKKALDELLDKYITISGGGRSIKLSNAELQAVEDFETGKKTFWEAIKKLGVSGVKFRNLIGKVAQIRMEEKQVSES